MWPFHDKLTIHWAAYSLHFSVTLSQASPRSSSTIRSLIFLKQESIFVTLFRSYSMCKSPWPPNTRQTRQLIARTQEEKSAMWQVGCNSRPERGKETQKRGKGLTGIAEKGGRKRGMQFRAWTGNAEGGVGEEKHRRKRSWGRRTTVVP